MKDSYDYQARDEARRLYMQDGLSLEKIAKRCGVKTVSRYLIPIFMREHRKKYEWATKSKAKHTEKSRAKFIKWYEDTYGKSDSKKSVEVKMIKQHKQCPINNWLTGAR